MSLPFMSDTPAHRGTGVRSKRAFCVSVSLWFGIVMAASNPASAQIRGFADVGSTTFAATESFETILGTATGVVFGGGVEVMLPKNIFASVRASRFRKTGERVFVTEGGERFGLGIPATITVTPIEFTGGYRFDRGWRVVPYGGGGFGRHRLRETSEFATDEENVEESFNGYHVLGGAEFRVAQWIGAAGELQWATVPDALGQDPNGVSNHFDETNLGGLTFRAKFVIGR
jgi:opacity protein-like surface antigen